MISTSEPRLNHHTTLALGRTIIDCSPLTIPNVFTPNNDGINENFHIISLDNRTVSLKIFSKWGNLVYHSDDYIKNWYGEGSPDGIYFYDIEDIEYSKNYKGVVQILR